MTTKKDKYPQVGPRDWMNRNGWYAEKGGYKPSQGVLPQVMPGMYPGNTPMVMNQHATQPMYMDIPAYADGGFYQKPGYFYNGHSMQKAAGSGTYAAGVYFEQGGYPHPLSTPFDTFEMGGYPHPLDTPFDEFKEGGNWIQGAVKHPGRCTPGSPNYDCPKGSPQWNLAQTFKKHHGFHEEGGYVDNDGDVDEMKKGGIHIKPENKGKFNALKKRTGKSTEELTHSKNPLTRKRAIFAQNAKKWKHETGGLVNPFHPIHQYADGGPYDEEGGVELPSANNPWGSSSFNTQDQMGQVYDPVAQANQQAPQESQYAWETKPRVTGERANMNEVPIPGAEKLNNPYQSQPEEESIPEHQKRNGFVNWGSAILGAGTGILGAASMMHDKYQNRKVQQQWLRDQNKSANLPTYINPMAHGTYDQFGNMPYNNMSQSPNIRTMQTGGYVKGSTHELSEQEIQSLLKKGYKLQRI